MAENDVLYDVVVIGGGPAGMLAAGRAASKGARVLLVEKNTTLGQKLLITGGGRCNLTNAQPDEKVFLGKFGKDAKFLFSAFSQFGVPETLEFFHKRHLYTKIEGENRVFPVTEQAQSVLDVLLRYMEHYDVSIRTNTPVSAFEIEDGKVVGVHAGQGAKKKLIRAHAFIVACGGTSHPETGSTGDGFDWMRSIGHVIADSDPALVPVKIKGRFVKKLSGLSLPEAKLTLPMADQKPFSQSGKFLFTHFGISGPLVLNMSKRIGEQLKYGEVTLSLDWMPHMDHGTVDRHIQGIFAIHQNKQIKNIIGQLVPPKMESVLLSLAEIDPDKEINKVTHEERISIVKILKGMELHVQGLLSPDKAIVASGGVSLKEIDFKTMESRLHANVFVVGDMLNIERPSGGYSLQLCWTTGFVAGTHAAKIGKQITNDKLASDKRNRASQRV
ncbi:MAG: NAD(P)/FAD-dependent oxidoreductase [Candidatus Moraniibacteriota bacterium]